MRIVASEMDGDKLILQLAPSALPEARRFVIRQKTGDYDLVRARKKRSLDANAYAWTLIDHLAAALRTEPAEVYRDAIRNIGGVSLWVCVTEKAADAFRRSWEGNGMGWMTETGPSKIDGCMNIQAWYGSSVYDVEQMSRLIDHLVQDCHALGIETRDPADIESMVSQWERK